MDYVIPTKLQDLQLINKKNNFLSSGVYRSN